MRPATLLALLALALAPAAHAADPVKLEIVLRDHRFVPAELRAPLNTPIELTVRNEDRTAEEFESHDLRVEKIVGGGKSILIRLRPLGAGSYRFFGEFHERTAQGVLVIQ